MLLEKIANLYVGIPISIFLDNARYQNCALVREKSKNLNIEMCFLPFYAPNLNLIKKMWKFVKMKCLYSKYNEKFPAFKARPMLFAVIVLLVLEAIVLGALLISNLAGIPLLSLDLPMLLLNTIFAVILISVMAGGVRRASTPHHTGRTYTSSLSRWYFLLVQHCSFNRSSHCLTASLYSSLSHY
ncbi:MAG: transposase [Anaerolineaceae bacterium]|nr:transposase [Anaerolineaceae bacterium]